ncbi:MAG: cyclic pyranopterin monophosphate synthase MoaC [Planctomycetaceae bacterium]
MRMIDVGGKPTTLRTARASALLRTAPETIRRIRAGTLEKGDAVAVARLAAVMAAKRTSDVVPLCHPLPLDAVEVVVVVPPADPARHDATQLSVEATVRATARTGVEMEALVAATAAALTLYDLCKSIDRGMTIEWVRLEEKRGGRHGMWRRDEPSGTT